MVNRGNVTLVHVSPVPPQEAGQQDRKSMIELESSPRSKQRNSHDNSLLDGQQEMPRNNSTKPSSGRYKNTPKSRMDSLLCGGGGWKVPAFQDAVECMGLGPIFDTGSPWIRRTFWFIVVCLGWVLAVYQIAEQIQVYFGWPVSSMVDIRIAKSLPFPRVSICNQNRIRSSALPDGSNPNATSLTDIFPSDMLSDSSVDWRRVYTDFAHWENNTVLSCTFKGRPCESDNISTIYSDHGACFAYNIDGTLHAQHSGSLFGLVLEMDTQLDNYVGITESMGFGIHISNYKMPLREGNAIEPGKLTYLQLQRRQITYLPPPWEDCGSLSLNDTPYYSYKACQFECETNYIIDTCHCQFASMRRNNVPVCDPEAETECAVPARHDFMEKGWPCTLACPQDCVDDQYLINVFHTSFSNSYLAQVVHRYGENENYWRKNLVKIIVYYPDLMEEVVTHHKVYSVFALLCDLGGALGLVLGASIITLLECFDHFFWRAVKKPREHSNEEKKRVNSTSV